MPESILTKIFRLAAICALLLHSSLAASSIDEKSTQTPLKKLKILILDSYHKDMPWSVGFEKGIKSGIQSWPAKVILYHEYLDASRFPINKNPAFLESLKTRYTDQHIDYVIALSEAAANFINLHRDFLPGVKYLSIDYGGKNTISQVSIEGNYISIGIGDDYKNSILAMTELTKEKLSRIYVVADTSETGGNNRLDGFKQAIQNSGISSHVEYLVNLGLDEYKNKLSQLPKNSVIYYLLLFNDPVTGKRFTPYRAVKELAATANAPIFSYWDALMGSGIIGGYLVSSEKFGQLAFRIISNLENHQVPEVTPEDGFTYLYDWRQLKRWNIPETQVFKGSEIRYIEPGIWENHKEEILFAIVLFLILIGFNFALSFEVKRKTRYLVVARDQAKIANTLKSEFLANISHELKTPLNVILSMTGFALEMSKDPKQTNFIEKTKIAAEKMHRLVNNILDFTDLEKGKEVYQPTPFPIRSVLNNLTSDLKSTLDEKTINLSVHLDPDFPGVVIGDPILLSKVLEQLSDNAIKFTAKGGNIDINISIENESDNTLLLHFVIKDSGIGIKEEDKEKLFQFFTQLDGSSTRKYGGVGIGLSLVDRMIKRMGGEIWVESEFGKGSSFHFTITMEKPAQPYHEDYANDSAPPLLSQNQVETETALKTLDIKTIAPMLQELYEEVSKDSIKSIELIAELLHYFEGTQYKKQMLSLNNAVRGYDFEQGLEILNSLMNKLKMTS